MEDPNKEFFRLMGEGKSKEATVFAIDNLRGEILADLASGNRKFWIDSFNNTAMKVFMSLPAGNREIDRLTHTRMKEGEENGEIPELAGKIRRRVEEGGEDATDEEKEKLLSLINRIKDLL